jgi:hypothetical protein
MQSRRCGWRAVDLELKRRARSLCP